MSGIQEMLKLRPSRRAPAEARRAVHEFAAAVAPSCAPTAELLTSELVTNAVTHGRGDVEVVMEYDDDGLAVRVSDEEPASPVLADTGPAAMGGRGMVLVEGLARSWGVVPRRDGRGKDVWFRLN
jgi:anti-sigma regulatory factor (Ser/Thr protein kinase)